MAFVQHDRATLLDMVSHINYEVVLLVGLPDRRPPDPTHADWLRGSSRVLAHSTWIESLVIHARNIHQFLATDPAKSWPDDVIATHYLPSWDSSGLSLLTPAELEDTHKRCAHLTTKRLTQHDGWNYVDIPRRLAVGVIEFVDRLDDPEYRRAFTTVGENARGFVADHPAGP